jgi:hypothetical protein
MTTKAAFTTDEWDLIRSAPPAAGMMVIAASHGGTIRETFEMAKVYADARGRHGDSELLDELVAAKRERDHTKAHSFEELKQNSVRLLGESVALLTAKATPEEVADYRAFILTLAERVAKRHEEDGVQISPAEQGAIDDVRAALG